MTSAAGSKPKAMQLKPTMEALGVVLAFICREQPYSEFRAAKIIAAVQHQLTARCHVCLIEDERLVAYAGWLPVTQGDAERWMAGESNLSPAPSSDTRVAALTIVSALGRRHVPLLIRECRRLLPQHAVYFKRDYAGGRTRKSKVVNRT